MQKIHGINESDLIERLKASDEIAFELLFRFYYAGLVVFANQIILNERDAEEIVQDFFVQVWEEKTQLKPTETIKPYLFTCVKNRAFNYLKGQGIRQRIHDLLAKQVEEDLLYNPDLFISSELQDEIQKAIEKLPDRCQEIFIKSRFDGVSNAEIAQELNISKRTVETQISKALSILRVELKDYLGVMAMIGMVDFF